MPSSDYDDLFQSAGQQYNVDPRLLKTIYNIESSANPETPDSEAGAQGGMQLMPATAAYLGVNNPKDMTQAIPGAARYVAEGLQKTGSPEGALAYYFAGPDQSGWGPKTSAYITKAKALYPGMTVASSGQSTASDAIDPDFASRWGGRESCE
jgi:soluble lytic murein transglycosylase-like protein